RTVRIALERAGRLAVGRERLGTRTERRLVRRQLDRDEPARKLALAGYVRVDFENAGSRLRYGGHEGFGSGRLLLAREVIQRSAPERKGLGSRRGLRRPPPLDAQTVAP